MSKKQKRPMSDRTYKLHEGQRCPVCKERAVELRGNVELDGPGGIAPAGCTFCGATWYECYEITGYCGLEKEGER